MQINYTNDIGVSSGRDTHSLLVFRVNESFFCTRSLAVESIIEPPKISRIPLTPRAVVGVTFFRGKPIPVVCLRSYLGEPINQKGVVIVAKTNDETIGVWVDEACNIIDANDDEFVKPDRILSRAFVKYFIPTADKILLYIELELLISDVTAGKSLTSPWRQPIATQNTQPKNVKTGTPTPSPLSAEYGNSDDDDALSTGVLSGSSKLTSNVTNRSLASNSSQRTTAGYPKQLASPAPRPVSERVNRTHASVIQRPGSTSETLRPATIDTQNSTNAGSIEKPNGKQHDTLHQHSHNKHSNESTGTSHNSSPVAKAISNLKSEGATENEESPKNTQTAGSDTIPTSVSNEHVKTLRRSHVSDINSWKNHPRNRAQLSAAVNNPRAQNFSDSAIPRVINQNSYRDRSFPKTTNELKPDQQQTRELNPSPGLDNEDYLRTHPKTSLAPKARVSQNKFSNAWLAMGIPAALLLALLLWWPGNDVPLKRKNGAGLRTIAETPTDSPPTKLVDDISKHSDTKTMPESAPELGVSSRVNDGGAKSPSVPPITTSRTKPVTHTDQKPANKTGTTTTAEPSETETLQKSITTAKPQTPITRTNSPEQPTTSPIAQNNVKSAPPNTTTKQQNGVILQLQTETYSITVERPNSNTPPNATPETDHKASLKHNELPNEPQSADTTQSTPDHQKKGRTAAAPVQSTGQTQAGTIPSFETRKPARYQKFIYVVVKGDTLWDIAAKFLGDPFKYKLLSQLSHVRNPDLIYPGDIVTILKVVR